MNKILIQSILTQTKFLPFFKNAYYKKEGMNKAVKISKDNFFKLYDSMTKNKNIEILPPLTKELL